jgi:hypothetical protein
MRPYCRRLNQDIATGAMTYYSPPPMNLRRLVAAPGDAGYIAGFSVGVPPSGSLSPAALAAVFQDAFQPNGSAAAALMNATLAAQSLFPLVAGSSPGSMFVLQSVLAPPTASPSSAGAAGGVSSSSSSSDSEATGRIVGGAVGGTLGGLLLIIVIVAIALNCRRKPSTVAVAKVNPASTASKAQTAGVPGEPEGQTTPLSASAARPANVVVEI